MDVSKLPIIIWLFLCCGCTLFDTSDPHKDLPNIVILLADDLGYGDLGCYGGVSNTPNLDRLAKEGIRFTDFYSAAPNCSPSRVGLLTGRSPSKVGMYNYLPPNHPMHLKAEEITIAEIVKKKGYRSGHFGKWHVSCLPQNPDLNQPQPDEQGFDYSLGTDNNARPSHLNPVNFVRNGVEVGEMKGYSCDIVVNEALNWLDILPKKNAPFLLYMAFHEPHKKVASPPELTAKYSEYPQADAEYLANVENMDAAIGRLLNSLNERNLDENTLILFASDNGSYRNGSNGKLLGGKSFVYEGGIRVPGILHWKNKIEPEQTISEPAGLVDLMPTICEVIGISHPRESTLDGMSLLPLAFNQSFVRSKPLSWFFYRTTPEMAMRIGKYAVLGKDNDSIRTTHPLTAPDMDYIKNMELDTFEVYDLTADISQENSLDYATLENGKSYANQLINRLKEIQEVGPYWENLPPATGNQKLKSQWRQLRPEGFSN